MTFASTAVMVIAAVQVLVVLACMASLLNVLVRHSENILYEHGLRLFAYTIVMMATATVLNFANEAGVLGRTFVVVSDAMYAVAAGLLVVATWQFSREFVSTIDDHDIREDDSADADGFGDA